MLLTILRYGAFLLAFTPAALAGDPAPARIPPVHATALNGDAIDLPATLKGNPAVLVMGFSQGSRGDVTAWGRRLAADFHDSAKVRYYEVSMLAGVPKFLRGYVLRKIAADVPDRAKPHFFSIDDHEAEWRTVASYHKPDDAYVLLVDGGGEVRWRAEGPVTDADYQQLRQQLDALRPRQ